MTNIIVTGLDFVRKALQGLAAQIPAIRQRQIYSASQSIIREMKQYPPERIGQLYVRTGRLGQGWGIQSNPDGYTIRNDTPYAPFVVGNADGLQQAWMHISTDQGKRWNLFRDVLQEETEKLPKKISDEIMAAAHSIGL